MFHIRRNHAKIADTKSKIVHGWDAAASLKIIPVTVDGLDVELVHGQTEPYIQGWHVVGHDKAPMWTPVFRWQAVGHTTRAWILVPAGADQKWCVDRVEVQINGPSALVLRCVHPNGSSDIVYRRDPAQGDHKIDGITLAGDVGGISLSSRGEVLNHLFVKPD
jgi:hypothetical protein